MSSLESASHSDTLCQLPCGDHRAIATRIPLWPQDNSPRFREAPNRRLSLQGIWQRRGIERREAQVQRQESDIVPLRINLVTSTLYMGTQFHKINF